MMVPHIPQGIVVAVAVSACLIPMGGLLATGLGGRAAGVTHWGWLGLYVMFGLLAWGGFVVGMALLSVGWGHPYRWTPVLELLGFTISLVIGFTVVRHAPRLRRAFEHRSGLWRLASFQVFRSLGFVFLILHAERKLPGLFAYPAAWGDIATGVTAPIAVWAVWFRESEIRRAGSAWRRAFIGWNLFGLADHLCAVTLGTLNFPGVTYAFNGPPDTAMFAELPMLLFPLFMVPFTDLAHLITIDALRRPATAGSAAPEGIAATQRPMVAAGGKAARQPATQAR